MYQWRAMTERERTEVLASRQARHHPWHSPPHWKEDGPARFHLSASCYEHTAIIGASPARMDSFAQELIATCKAQAAPVFAWCLLPNHYHLLIETDAMTPFTRALGQFHGRNSHDWNQADHANGRKVFYRTAERRIRSDGHFWANVNYIHHNPVHHQYVAHWTDWPWSDAREYLTAVGRDEAARIWHTYPVLDYGAGWDNPNL
jgi:putative transposase